MIALCFSKRTGFMKKLVTTFSTACLLLSAVAWADINENTVSYAMGFKTGQAMKAQSITVNTQRFSQGLQDGYTGKQPSVSEADMQTALTNMQKKVIQNMQQQSQAAAEKNEQEGQAFLAKNAKLPGVVTTASGLQYKIIDQGNGNSPTANDTVTVNYEGTLINGTVFDSSYQRKTPATFRVGAVIKGWQEALTLMKPGATWMLYIPSNLAYGKQGDAGAIGPNETLLFKVNLISVKSVG